MSCPEEFSFPHFRGEEVYPAFGCGGFCLFTGVPYLYLPCVLRILILLFATLSCSFGQTITVTIQGQVEDLSGMLTYPYSPTSLLDSSVQIGTPFTFVQTIDATAQPDPVFGDYLSGPSFVSSLRVGDYDFESSGSTTYVGPSAIELFPNFIEGQDAGFDDPEFQAQLFENATVPDPSLNTLLQDSMSDFVAGVGAVQLYDYEGEPFQNLLLGSITSYSAIETPEPSIWALLLCGLGFIGVTNAAAIRLRDQNECGTRDPVDHSERNEKGQRSVVDSVSALSAFQFDRQGATLAIRSRPSDTPRYTALHRTLDIQRYAD